MRHIFTVSYNILIMVKSYKDKDKYNSVTRSQCSRIIHQSNGFVFEPLLCHMSDNSTLEVHTIGKVTLLAHTYGMHVHESMETVHLEISAKAGLVIEAHAPTCINVIPGMLYTTLYHSMLKILSIEARVLGQLWT